MEMTKEDRIAIFRDFMRLPTGDSLVPEDVIQQLVDKGFFTAPASTKFHGAYEGGLFDHSYSVATHLVKMTHLLQLPWGSDRSPYLVGMFHDLCKIDQYRHPAYEDVTTVDGKPVIDTEHWEYNPDTLLKGHGDKSVMLLSQFFQLTKEEIVCIRYHMGAFTDKAEWDDYTRAVRRYSNVLWTHQADMLASHVEGV